MSEEIQTNGKGQIYGLIAQIIKQVKPIKKGRTNEQQGYRFRGIDDVYEAVHPLFAEHGVFTVPRILNEQTTERTTERGTVLRFVNLTVAYDFFAPDGSSVTAEVIGEAMDAGDKASNKAMSAAQKYALIQTLCIPTGSTPDADYETHDEIKPATRVAPDVPSCPECKGPMWDNRTTRKGRQPHFKCKDKSCGKGVWVDKENPIGNEQVLRDELFNQAEKYMIARNYPEDKRKDALGRLVAMTTDKMAEAVDKLISSNPTPPIEKEKQDRIDAIRRDVPEKLAVEYMTEKYPGKRLEELSLDALNQMYDDLGEDAPF